MTAPRRLTAPQLAALRDAHGCINNGGLRETRVRHSMATRWVGDLDQHPDGHANSTIHFLFTEGLVQRIQIADSREAFITDLGLLELDAAREVEDV